MRYLIVANPTAGRRGGPPLVQEVAERLKRGSDHCAVETTQAKGHGEEVAVQLMADAKARGDDRVCLVACGGDGTIQEVVNAFMSADVPGAVFGVIPAGRCNDFASAVGLPRDPAAIATMLLAGQTRRVDVARVNGRYFCSIAALGFDAAVARLVNDSRLPIHGTMAYLIGVLRVLAVYRSRPVTITTDGETIDGPVFLAATANTPSYGGQMRIAPDARMDDGLLDVCLVSPVSRLKVLRLIPRVLKGRHTNLPEVRMLRTRSMRISSADPLEIWADGEFAGTTPVTFEAAAKALELVVPANGDAI